MPAKSKELLSFVFALKSPLKPITMQKNFFPIEQVLKEKAKMPNDETIKAMKECGKISQNDDIVEANNVANISKSLQAIIKEIIFKNSFKKAHKQGLIGEWVKSSLTCHCE